VTAWIGAAGSVLFVSVFLADGWTRPGYSPSRQPVSALALGPRGWVQTSNFLVCGVAVTIGGWGLVVSAPDVLPGSLLGFTVIVLGLGLVASGIFPMDPMRGYPPGTPDGDPESFSNRHTWHDHAGMVVFLALPAAAAVAAFGLPDALGRTVSGLAAAGLFLGFGAFGTAWENDSPRAGLVQRAVLVPGCLWIAVLFLVWPES
jgi:hypothetical protein